VLTQVQEPKQDIGVVESGNKIMSSIPLFNLKDYLDKTVRLKDHGTIDVSLQIAKPISAGARGLRKTQMFIKDPVHLMGEDVDGRPSPSQPNAVVEKQKTKNSIITGINQATKHTI
jgi:hypothetical protein